jgi:hypothetical protein
MRCVVIILAAACSPGAVLDGNLSQPPRDPPDPGPIDPGPVDPPPKVIPPFAPAPASLKRLTRRHYEQTIRDLLGDVTVPSDLEVDTPLYGFTTVGAASLTVSPRAAEQFEAAALDLARQLFSDGARRESFVGCAPATADEPCVRAFIDRFGLRAFRRPLTIEELDRWSALAVTIATSFRDVWVGLEMTVAGILQSPYFLYRVELGTPDPEDGTRLRYASYEMASRLSYFIASTTPDDELLDAAAAGGLDDAAGIRREVLRLLDREGAKASLGLFFEEHLKLDRLNGLTKDGETYPQMSVTLPAAMKGEVLALVEDIVFARGADLRELFSGRTTFVNAELARVYNLPGIEGDAFQRFTFPANSPRAGILTSPGFLALNSHATATSPTFRGKYVRQALLCQEIPPPPPGVTTTLPEPDPNAGPQTLRQRLETLHLANPTCAACHNRMDPVGFGFESFDAIGAYRTTDNGLPVDPTGDLDGQRFRSTRELAELVARHENLGPCLSRMAYRYASAHLETDGETQTIEDVSTAFATSGYRFKDLVVAIATSDGFRLAAVE